MTRERGVAEAPQPSLGMTGRVLARIVTRHVVSASERGDRHIAIGGPLLGALSLVGDRAAVYSDADRRARERDAGIAAVHALSHLGIETPERVHTADVVTLATTDAAAADLRVAGSQLLTPVYEAPATSGGMAE